MDTTNWLIFGAILAVAGVVALVLRRSWGGFGGPPALPPNIREIADADNVPWLVRIEQPYVRQAAESALRRGGPVAQRVVRSGDNVYFAFDHIADAAERQAAVDLMRRMQTGQDVDMRAALRLAREMFKV
ncbi:MAG TPA: hypothetical protein VD886_21720 [Herpetosiphonaceae bacterium]|nr:hypothetical protein [Herpetosiphonaceae bacterium]